MDQQKSYLIPDAFDDTDSFGRLLYFSAERGNLLELKKIVTSLLSKVEEAQKQNRVFSLDISSTLYTPLFLASKEGHHECVKFLLDHGASLEGRPTITKSAWSPLWVATYSGHHKCVEHLINAGANLEGGFPETPIFIAAIHEQVACLKLLCEAGANLDVQGKVHLFTPLHVLVVQGRAECVFLLANSGANLELVDAHGDTPLLCATKYAKVACMKVLLMFGANQDTFCSEGGSFGNNSMHIAACKSQLECIVLLWNFGMNPRTKNNSNLKPSDLAVSNPCKSHLLTIERKIRSLKDLCRIVIRGCHDYRSLCKLTESISLPQSVKDYLFHTESIDLKDFTM